MAFGEAKQIVDGFDPAFGEGLFLDDGRKDGTEGLTQTKDFQENGVDGLRLGVEQGMKACGVTTRALTRKETNSSQERLCAAGAVLAKSRARRPAMRRGWVYVGAMEDLEETWFVVTGFMSHTGYSMSGVVCAACLETFLGAWS